MEGTERRKYPRHPVHYSVNCTIVDKDAKTRILAVAENASRTGLKLRFSGLFTPNDPLKLEIFKSITSKPIVCYGKVIWVKESPLVYGEKMAGIHITKIGWTESSQLVTNSNL